MSTKKTDGNKKKRACPSARYPILYHIGDIPIRHVNVITLYIPEVHYVKMVRAMEGSGAPMSKVLAASGQPCSKCKDDLVPLITRLGTLMIPKGLLKTNKQTSGTGRKRKKTDDNKNT